MPISAIDSTTADHWTEVKNIIIEALENIEEPKFITNLVSDADEVGVIQKRIIQNVYNSDIIVCDVSAKNPNVMFELGLRLAFDKPTVIIKDDKTDYSFDTGVIEHIGYPRDLRFAKIVDFKKKLAEKVQKTYAASLKEPKHSPFLGNFGEFHVASIPQTAVPADAFIVEMLSDIQQDIRLLKRREIRVTPGRQSPPERFGPIGKNAALIDKAVLEVLEELPLSQQQHLTPAIVQDLIKKVQERLLMLYGFVGEEDLVESLFASALKKIRIERP